MKVWAVRRKFDGLWLVGPKRGPNCWDEGPMKLYNNRGHAKNAIYNNMTEHPPVRYGEEFRSWRTRVVGENYEIVEMVVLTKDDFNKLAGVDND